MKNGTLYAVKVKKVFGRLRKGLAATDDEQAEVDPLTQLAHAIIACSQGENKATKAVQSILEHMVGWNEIRVSTPEEVEVAAGVALTDGRAVCKRLVRALQSIYDRENRMCLEALKSMGRRDAKAYLEKLESVDEYVVASVMLWSLGGHAIPVSDAQLETLRRAELVEPSATRAEVQAFLERNIAAADAKTFCLVLDGASAAKLTGTTERAARKKSKAKRKTKSKSKAKAGRKKTKTRSRSAG